MFIVTGATGKLGRKIVEQLLRRVPANNIGLSVRDPEKAADFEERGVRVRRGDYRDVNSLRLAWADVTRLLLVSSNAAATGGDPLAEHAIAINVARELGVERVFYTSQVSSSPISQFPPGRDHAATENMLANSGLAWTSMRHGFYAQSALLMNAHGFETGSLDCPEDGKVAWTTHDDLAAADVALLTSPEPIDGATPPLTGSEALDLADISALAAEIYGRPISRTYVSDATMAARLSATGMPQGVIAVMSGYYRAARAGEFQAVDPTLSETIGRAPETMAEFMKYNL